LYRFTLNCWRFEAKSDSIGKDLIIFATKQFYSTKPQRAYDIVEIIPTFRQNTRQRCRGSPVTLNQLYRTFRI